MAIISFVFMGIQGSNDGSIGNGQNDVLTKKGDRCKCCLRIFIGDRDGPIERKDPALCVECHASVNSAQVVPISMPYAVVFGDCAVGQFSC